MKNIKPTHPQKSLSEALAELPEASATNKSVVLVSASATSDAAPRHPDESQLEKINQFTLTPKRSEELWVFSTLSMNDLVDRDNDFFDTEAVKGILDLPQPFSSIGKSFMVDHQYKMESARGRIFDAEIVEMETDLGKATFLKNWVYVPNTPQYADFIEAQDFGVNWAVSVGVTVSGQYCSVGEPHAFSSHGYWCSEGHDKGLYYDPSSTEKDPYGWPTPVSPESSGAVKCVQGFGAVDDFYELSQVFLGAQYFAALEGKTPGGLGIEKSVGGIVSLPGSVAKEIEFSTEPERVKDARRKGITAASEDGEVVWTDDDGIGWSFDPLDPEQTVLCTGKTVDEEADEDVVGDTPDPEAQEVPGDEEDPVVSEDAEAPEETVSEDVEVPEAPTLEGETDGLDEAESVEIAASPSIADNDEIQALAGSLGLTVESDDDIVELVSAAARKITEAAPKVAMIDKYIASLRSDAVNFYVRANLTGDSKGVRTETFEKMLDRIGDDPDLLLEVVAEQKSLAKSRFPSGAIRSSFPAGDEVNERKSIGQVENHEFTLAGETTKEIERRHGVSR